MGKELRKEAIVSLLQTKRSVSVQELSARFDTSAVTIRKDLAELEQANCLTRTHGGAILKKENTTAASAVTPGLTERQIKIAAVAKLAASYIQEDSWIYLSSGVTCYEIARLLENRHMTVITGGIDTAQFLAGMHSLEVYLPGGKITKTTNHCMLSGEWYLRSLDDIRVNQAFISISGIDMDGYSVANPSELLHMDKLKEISDETIVVADSTKFDHKSFLIAEPLDYVDTVITNRDIPDNYRQYFSAHGIKLITD